MVSAGLRVVNRGIETNDITDGGDTRHQEDRRGILAVKNGPPTRGSSGLADRDAFPADGRLELPVSGPRAYAGPDPPRVPTHSGISK